MSIRDYRRDLHRIPELDFDLPQTLAYLRTALAKLPGTVIEPAPSSLCIYFDAGAPDTIAFRADMDALPVTEDPDREYRSEHEGKMHACGHDAHMAMLLGLCDFVGEHLDQLPHNVLAIFQPAEETIGGAEGICRSGIFQQYGVRAVFGLHMWPGLPAGTIASRPGPLMARSSEITVDVIGHSVHIAKADQGRDALMAAAHLLTRVEAQVQQVPGHRLLSFGYGYGGTVRNAVAGTAHLEGTMRSFSDQTFEQLRTILLSEAQSVEAETGCQVLVDVTAGYPPVINDEALLARVEQLAPIHRIEDPQMTGEDFSFYQREVPGVFFFVGTGNEAALHSSSFDLDEAALDSGLDLLRTLLFLEGI